jgi:hypothetical protein
MRQVQAHLQSLTPYSQSRKHDAPKLDKETADAYDQRTWREKCTVNKDGIVVIPAMALKFALPTAARKLGRQIPGRGKSTYTKFFEADVICEADVPIGIRKDEVPSITIQAHAQGSRTDGKRVPRTFPIIHEWTGVAHFLITDDTITREIFEETLTAAGLGVGIGRFRPENGGLNGRFKVDRFVWK